MDTDLILIYWIIRYHKSKLVSKDIILNIERIRNIISAKFWENIF